MNVKSRSRRVPGSRPGSQQRSNRDVFVIHGRDEAFRTRIFELLRAFDLKPLSWEALVHATGTVAPDLLTVILAALKSGAQAVVVLLTPDDVVHLHPKLRTDHEVAIELEPAMQARPNVLIELGMALALCAERTILLESGNLRPIADLGGLNVIKFDGSVGSIGKLEQRLRTAGCAVDISSDDWRSTYRFTELTTFDRQPES